MTFGSTGIFRAFYMGDWPDGSIIADDCCTHPDGSMWKPLDQLDDAERERLGQCDASLAAHMDRMARMAESFDDHGDE